MVRAAAVAVGDGWLALVVIVLAVAVVACHGLAGIGRFVVKAAGWLKDTCAAVDALLLWLPQAG